MKHRVYLDTSVISALFDTRTPERQVLTTVAWERLSEYEACVSQAVLSEMNNAPPPLRAAMRAAIAAFPVLAATTTAMSLAQRYVEQGIFPEKYFDDALHVAIASINGVGILLSWNFAHLVKLKTRRMVALINTAENYLPVEIISPPEL